MTRLPAALVVLLLHREAADKGRPELAVTTATLRQWKCRKHLSKGPDYDLFEVMEYIEARSATRPLTSLDSQDDQLSRFEPMAEVCQRE